jgi:pilus assembly protein Flp/PilA
MVLPQAGAFSFKDCMSFISKFCLRISRYCALTSGATAIEYGLIAAGIALAIMAALFLFGGSLEALYTTLEPLLAAIASNIPDIS